MFFRLSSSWRGPLVTSVIQMCSHSASSGVSMIFSLVSLSQDSSIGTRLASGGFMGPEFVRAPFGMYTLQGTDSTS